MSGNTDIISSVSIEEMMKYMREIGYQVSPADNKSIGPLINVSSGMWPFHVFLFGAEGEQHYSAASVVAFLPSNVSLEFVNRWNREFYFTKAVVREVDNSAVLEMNFVLIGVTMTYLRRCFGIWENGLRLFLEKSTNV